MVSKAKAQRPPKDSNWISAEKARHLTGGAVLRPRLIEHPEADGRLVLPNPKFFRGDGSAIRRNGNGASVYDGTSIDLRGAFFGGTSVVQFGMSLSDQEHTERPYAENVWVRAAVKAFSNGFSKLPLVFYDRDPEDADARIVETPLTKLFQRPNRAMSQLEFFRAHVVNFKHDGEVYWFLMNAAGDPVATDDNGFITEMPEQILPLRGALVDVLTDKSGFPEWYRYRRQRSGSKSKGEHVKFPAAAVIPFLDFDPYNMIRGLGDVKALIREVDLYFQAYRYLDAVVKNGGDPGGFIVYEERIGDAELDRRQGEADDEYALTNAGRFKVLDRGAKFVPNNTKPKDMQYPSLFAWQREAILTGIGVPPPVVGVLDNAIYNNIETARREMWVGPNGILTVNELTEDVMRNKLVWRLQRVQGVGDVWPHFDTSKVQALSINREEKIERAATIASKGIGVSMNESLELQGIDGEFPKSGNLHLVDQKFDVPKAEADALGLEPPPPPPPMIPPLKKEGEEEDDDTNALLAPGLRAGKGVGKTAVDETGVPDPKLAERVEAWLVAYEKAQIQRFKSFSKSGRADLTKEQTDMLLLNNEEWIERLERMTRVPIRDIWKGALAFAQGQIGGPFLKVTDPAIVEMIATQVLQLSEGVTSSTAQRVRDAILRVLAGAEDAPLREVIKELLPELTEELRRVFGSKDARANAIAITEHGRAQNQAAFEQMRESGVESHRWVNAGDDDVRKSHRISEVVLLGQEFPNGLRFPHDPLGPASEVINCRCKTQVVEQGELEEVPL